MSHNSLFLRVNINRDTTQLVEVKENQDKQSTFRVLTLYQPLIIALYVLVY